MSDDTPFLGIDFGTSYSSMAWYNPAAGQAELLMNAEGEYKTPSVVYFGDEILVGAPADELLADEADAARVVVSVKRDLTEARFALPDGRRLAPVDIAAAILAKLKRDAEIGHFHRPVTHAVITCPARFDFAEKEQIELAARQAGFAEVTLLEEPVAAALAFQRAGFAVGQAVLVYDLGGGTFDVAVLAPEDDGFRLALPPDGIRKCGGDDFDRALYDACTSWAQQELGVEVGGAGALEMGLLRECRRQKEQLSARTQSRLVYRLADGAQVRRDLTRVEFETLIQGKVGQTVRLTQGMLKQATTRGIGVETVVLIGGSARIPLVKQLLNDALPSAPLVWEKQDVAVALGAAHHARQLWGRVKASAAGAALPAAPVVNPPVTTPQPTPSSPIVGAPVDSALPLSQRFVAELDALDGEFIRRAHSNVLVARQAYERDVTQLAQSAQGDSGRRVSWLDAAQLLRGVTGRLQPDVARNHAANLRRAAESYLDALSPRDAQRADSREQTRITVDPAGKGDVRTLDEALRLIAPGGEIRLAAGEHRLHEPLTIDKPVALVGAGIDKTTIAYEGEGFVVKYNATGTFSANGVTFEHHGDAMADVIVVEQGAATLISCRLTGGCGPTDNPGVGLVIFSTEQVVVSGCIADENDAGILIGGDAQPLLERNSCYSNRNSGLAYVGHARGTARQNVCMVNARYGIYVGTDAQPILENNTCRENHIAGIAYGGNAAGVARQNTCSGNGNRSILIREQAQPRLDNNSVDTPIFQERAQVTVGRGGDCATIEEGLDLLTPGGTLRLLEGTYYLAEPLSLGWPLQIEGAGMSRTTIVCEGAGHVISFSGEAEFALRNVALRHPGVAGADVFVALDGEVELTNCKFSGGVRSDSDLGSGIYIGKSAKIRITGCQIEENAGSGIAVMEQASAELVGNTCSANGLSGMLFMSQGECIARRNACSSNGLHGMHISGEAHPTLEENVCMSNVQVGIAYFGAGAGEAKDNKCEDNQVCGIYVDEQARPSLVENHVLRNHNDGIAYFETGAGRAIGNTCNENKASGISINQQATPSLERNECSLNAVFGIYFREQAGGAANSNTCSRNGRDGIKVEDEALVQLIGNNCWANKQSGISFASSKTGSVARNNTCRRNGENAIHESWSAAPLQKSGNITS